MIRQSNVKAKSASRGACKLCTPLGACLAAKGIERAMPLLHGSQGCATYIRRYMISHYREPIDIASSNFSETSAIFGGKNDLHDAVRNVVTQYDPSLVLVATTCLTETIGDDVGMFLREMSLAASGESLPPVVHVSTASYRGTHADGFHAAVRAAVATLAENSGESLDQVNLFSGMVSAADLRYLREITEDFGIDATIVPDYSDVLDGPAWDDYHLVPEGGTPIERIRQTGRAAASIEMTSVAGEDAMAGRWLEANRGVPNHRLPLPIGVVQTDKFFAKLEEISGCKTPMKHRMERGRLIDSYVDSHKYMFGRRVALYGEEDLVVGLAALLLETGAIPVLCASGGKSGRMREALTAIDPNRASGITVLDGVDHAEIEEAIVRLEPDLMIGPSKGYKTSRKLDIPLVRVGFPIHDRMGGARQLHLGYRGAQQLFDRIVNTIMERKQADSAIGYTYM